MGVFVNNWVFPAGEPVFDRSGSKIGIVGAVRPGSFLIIGINGGEAWSPHSNLTAIETAGLVISVVPEELTARDQAPNPSDIHDEASINALLIDGPQSYNA